MFPSLTMRTFRTGSYAPGRGVYDLPLYDTLYIIELQCTSVQDRQQSINQKVQIKGNCWARNGFVYRDFTFADFAQINMIYSLDF